MRPHPLGLFILALALTPAWGQEEPPAPPPLAETVFPAGDPWEWIDPIPPIAMTGIETTLSAQLMTLEDFHYQKDPLDDPWRLDIVTKSLDDPLSLYDTTWDWSHRFEQGAIPLAGERGVGFSDPKRLIATMREGGQWQGDVSRYQGFLHVEPAAPVDVALLKSMYAAHAEVWNTLPSAMHLGIAEQATWFVIEDAEDPDDELTDLVLEGWDVLRQAADGEAWAQYQHTSVALALIAASGLKRPFSSEELAEIAALRPRPTVIQGTTEADHHIVTPGAIILDPGGDDRYTFTGEITFPQALTSFIVDESGNDSYDGDMLGAAGSGLFGTGILIDRAGDDVYRTGHISQGAALYGVGILVDRAGDDFYEGGDFVQGAAMFGLGLLQDDLGDDTYRATLYAQACAITGGIGLLCEYGGDDTYYAGGAHLDYPRWPDNYLSLSQAFAYGIRPTASGGIAFLGDYAGNDFYSAEVYGQGVAYWYALAMLVDRAGNDWYTCLQYGQGSGIHLAAGSLIDVAGSDHYTGWALLQGNGHDLGVGVWLDMAGRDFMHGVDLCQGAGQANGFGLAIDLQGDDSWLATNDEVNQGFGNNRRDYGSIGLLIDILGNDQYSHPDHKDSTLWTSTTWGAGFDMGTADTLAEGVEY